MWQNAVFNANLNDDRENTARSSATNAQALRGGALRAGIVLMVGFVTFLDSEGQFTGDRGRTNLYINLVVHWREIAAMQKAEPAKTRRDLQKWLIEDAKIPISDDAEWFDHLCDEIGLSMRRRPVE